MQKWIVMAGLVLAAAACSDADAPLSPSAAGPRLALSGVDADGDYLDDGLEMELAERYAPVLYMPNLVEPTQGGGDWTWPATVDWYLSQSKLRFHHGYCPDDPILDVGQVTPPNLIGQWHRRASSWVGCFHTDDWFSSGGGAYDTDNRFFLTPHNPDAVRPGVRDKSQWKAYFHAYRNTIGGINIQYWIFYAYNDFHGTANHEGDWEHVNVRLNAAHQPEGVWFARHTHLYWKPAAEVFSYGGTHPVVWVADGSHASFATPGECNTIFWEGFAHSCWANDSQRWFTWGGGPWYEQGIHGAGLVNMGENFAAGTGRRPMPGQEWVRYLGMWGELGTGWTTGKTNGPMSPAYQDDWDHDMYVPSAGGGGGECYSGDIAVRDPVC
jgi:hypothetical protein